MSNVEVVPVIQLYSDVGGKALDDGFVYIGTSGLDPVANPISVFWDEALTIPAPNPVRTRNGHPDRSGAPARFFVNADSYSFTVKNKNGTTVYNALDSLSASDIERRLRNSADPAKGAGMVGFIQLGAGAVGRTSLSKFREKYSFKDFGAVADGVTDDTAAINLALANAPAQTEFANENFTFRVTAPLVIQKAGTTIRGGRFLFDAAYSTPDASGFISQAVFETAPIAVGSSLDDISFVDVYGEAIGTSGADTFLFQSRTVGPTRFFAGRVNRFRMESCQTKTMKLCHAYGENVIVSNNVAVNAGSWQFNSDRNFAISINQLISDIPDISGQDSLPSSCTITGNRTYYFGGGILVHHFFNNANDARRVMRNNIVANNTVIGWRVDEAAAAPSTRKKGNAGIYFGSIKDIQCTGNIVKNHDDMCIDFEFCNYFRCSDNQIHNGGVVLFWDNCNDGEIVDNKFTCDHADYLELIRLSGGGTKHNIEISGNTFRNYITASVSNLSFGNSTDNVNVTDNKFYDVEITYADSVTHSKDVVSRNRFYLSVDRASVAGSANIVHIRTSGIAEFNENTIESAVAQTGTEAAFKVTMRRISGVDPTFADVRENRIVGFTNSLHVAVSGTAFANWIVNVVRNEYDGTLTNEITRTDNRVFLYDNYKVDATRKIAAAHPDTPPVTGNYAKGSRIPLFLSLTGAASEVFSYVCVAETMGTGGTWKSQTADYAP